MSIQTLADLAGVGPVALAALDFMRDADCVDEDPAIFFPDGRKGRGNGPNLEPAYRICGKCRVTRRCADYALSERIMQGVFGGLSEVDRAELVTAHESPGVCDKCSRPTALGRALCNNCRAEVKR